MTNDLQMPMNEYLPLRDVVFQTLRQAIMRGDLKPGERLMEIKLANRLGVSRTPIREAIRMLELEGLVIMIPRKGAQVAQITEKDLNDVLEVRLGLEALAINFAVERITAEQLEALEHAAAEFELLIDSDDLTAVAEADVHFHDLIYEATDNKRLEQLLNNLREQMYRYRIEYLKDKSSRRELVSEHYAIFEAIRDRACEEACRIMQLHISNQQKAIMRGMQKKTNTAGSIK